MKNPICLIMALLLAWGAGAQEAKHELLFDPGQTQLNDQQKEEIAAFAERLRNKERLTVFPLTHDPVFDRLTYTKDSKQQAEAIAAFAETLGFEKLGIPRNFPSAYKGLSVRVDLRYHAKKEAPLATETPDPSFMGLQEKYPEKPSQFFLINPNKDTLLVGEEGTQLLFKAGALMSDGMVQVELKEFYNLDDYMKNGLPTISNGKMIETGGSIYLNAKQVESGKTAKINPGIGVDIGFALDDGKEGMEIFVKDPKSSEMNWILPKKTKEEWVMTDTELDENGNIISQKTFTSKEAWEAHLAKEARDKEINEANQEIMGEKLTAFQLGFINCDRFPEEEIIPFQILADTETPAEYYLVYHNVRGMMKGIRNGDQIRFQQVPANRQATLIAVSFVGEQAYFFKSSVTANSSAQPTVRLTPVEQEYVDKQLAMLK